MVPGGVQLTQIRWRWSSLNQLVGVWMRPCHVQPECRDVAVPLPWSREEGQPELPPVDQVVANVVNVGIPTFGLFLRKLGLRNLRRGGSTWMLQALDNRGLTN